MKDLAARTEIEILTARVKRVETLVYLILGAVLATHFIDPTWHLGVLQFP